MRMIALVVTMMVLGFAAHAEAGRGGSRRGSYSSRSYSTSSGTGASSSSHSVRGYTRRNGTYVAPHYKTNPDRTQRNNYSTKGNVNTYTGKTGTRRAAY
jgi:hypothetical protein